MNTVRGANQSLRGIGGLASPDGGPSYVSDARHGLFDPKSIKSYKTKEFLNQYTMDQQTRAKIKRMV